MTIPSLFAVLIVPGLCLTVVGHVWHKLSNRSN
jgi:hypothetical protein